MNKRRFAILLLGLLFLSLSFHFRNDWQFAEAQPSLTIDMIYVADERVDVGEVTYVGFHVIWYSTGSSFVGKLLINNWPGQWYTNLNGWCIIPVFSNEVGSFTWSIKSIYYGTNEMEFQQLILDPEVVVDTVQITLMTPSERIGVNNEATIIWSGKYSYDETPFRGDIVLNYDNLTSSDVEERLYEVTQIIDTRYGLQTYESNTVKVITDRVDITLNVEKDRIDLGSAASIDISAIYAYDGEPFYGWIEYNNDITQNKIGKYTFTVESIRDIQHNVDSFSSNNIEIVYDAVIVNISVEDDRINVGDTVNVIWTAVYGFDLIPFEGRIFFNLSPFKSNTIMRKAIRAIDIQDPIYKLEAIISDEVEVVWDRINVTVRTDDKRVNIHDNVSLQWTAVYESDGADFNGEVTISPNVTQRDRVGHLVYRTTAVNDPVHGITEFTTNSFTVIWDRVNLEFSFPYDRMKIGSYSNPSVSGFYEYDDTPFLGNVEYNDTLTKNEPGKYGFTIIAMDDQDHHLSEFISNDDWCIWDDVLVDVKIKAILPSLIQVTSTLVYTYDGQPVENMMINVNGKRAEEIADGRYRVQITNLLPLFNAEVVIENLIFGDTYTYRYITHIGNVILYVVILVVILIVLRKVLKK